MFTATDAKSIAEREGYKLNSEPLAEKKHFVATATKDGQTFKIDIHKDGDIVEDRPFEAATAKKLAADNGYGLTSDLRPEKKHFVATGTKNGMTYELDIHRDGSIKEHAVFSAAQAMKIAADDGYAVIAEPRREKKHFQLLGKKDGKFFAFDAHRDGSLKALREVDKKDPTWGSSL